MRIIAGELRGRRILPPEASDTTRPITDRAKQSLFDIVTPLLDDAIVYDCFAGTGSMGLESLSRGARRASFFESDRSALSRLRTNIESLGLNDRATVMAGDIFKILSQPPPAAVGERNVDVIFLDPPYRFLIERPEPLKALSRDLVEYHLKPAGFVVFRHHANDAIELPALIMRDQRKYGEMTIDILSPKASDSDRA